MKGLCSFLVSHYRGRKNLGGDKIVVDKVGSPPSYQIFRLILWVLWAKNMCTGAHPGTLHSPSGNISNRLQRNSILRRSTKIIFPS